MSSSPRAAARTPLVLKLGGRELEEGPALARAIGFVVARRALGEPVIVVHGGGDAISRRADQLGLPTLKVRGQRVTSPEMMEVVLEVLAGRINARLTAAFGSAGVPALGLTTAAGPTLVVRPAGDPPGALGAVGQPEEVHRGFLDRILGEGYTPVLAPIGVDRSGTLYNVNADVAAGALAGAFRAPLMLLTDVPAVRDRGGRALPELDLEQARELLHGGVAIDGMVPKLEAAIDAVRRGAPSVWIGDASGLATAGASGAAGTRLLGRRGRPRPPTLPARSSAPSRRNER